MESNLRWNKSYRELLEEYIKCVRLQEFPMKSEITLESAGLEAIKIHDNTFTRDPVFIDAGKLVDPIATLVSAKQLATSLERDVEVRLNIDEEGQLVYYIHYDKNMMLGVITEVIYTHKVLP